MKNKQSIYSITAIIVILDIIIKVIVQNNLVEDLPITIIPNFFSLYYTKNTGVAFSLLQNSTILIIILSIIVLVILDNYIKKLKDISKVEIVSLGLTMGGIYGNLIDRIINHSVTDYLSFRIFNYNFPVFNLADICITIGVLLLIINMLKEEAHKNEK